MCEHCSTPLCDSCDLAEASHDCQNTPSTTEGTKIMPEYTFDIVAVATFHIGAPDYPTARQALEGAEAFEVPLGAGDYDHASASFTLTCVAPRGKASFFAADPEDDSIPAGDVQTFDEPLLDARDTLKEALAEADEALGGDSNDAEHDALYSVRETIAGLLGVTTDPPSPYDEPWPPTCVLTGQDGENPDDCTTHEHEED